MGTLVISENITLDGVIEDPTGDDGFSRGGWFTEIGEADRQAWAEVEAEEAMAAEALLIGRRTYHWLIARGWRSRIGPWADRLTVMPKYVVSSTLTDPDWANTTVLAGDPVNEVTKLKERLDGEIVVNGSGRLARTLIEHDLVDEVRLMVYPFVLGEGERLFPTTTGPRSVRLVESRTVGTGLALLSYRCTPTDERRPAP
jgi:dihydrofolate reductase